MPKDLTVIPVGLSPEALNHIIELLDYDYGSGEEGTDADLSRKIRDELRVARDATPTSGITDETRRAMGLRRGAADLAGTPEGEKLAAQASEAERIAGKMAKAARKAVDK